MQDTLKMLRTLITEESKEMTNEQLAEAYKKDKNPIYFATAFCKAYKLIRYVAENYIRDYGLTEEDVASYSLEKLDYCLLNYSDKAHFTTFFVTVLKNKFRTETQALSMQKRCTMLYSSSLDDLHEQGWDASEENDIGTEDILIGHNLTAKEKEYCRYIMSAYTNKEIAEKMNVSIMTLCNYRKNLRLKFSEMLL